MFDSRGRSWEQIVTAGAVPEPRFDHCAVVCPESDMMYVWGGNLLERSLMYGDDNVHRLDLRTNRWEMLAAKPHKAKAKKSGKKAKKKGGGGGTVGVWPDMRTSAFSALYNGQLFVFGGEWLGYQFSELWIFNPNSAPPEWRLIKPTGSRPPTR